MTPDNIDFSYIVKVFQSVQFDTVRASSDKYFEAVFKNDISKIVLNELENFLGKPVYPAAPLPKDIEAVVEQFGGVRNDQQLFFYKGNAVCIFAMLWPWQNGIQVTLKLGKINI